MTVVFTVVDVPLYEFDSPKRKVIRATRFPFILNKIIMSYFYTKYKRRIVVVHFYCATLYTLEICMQFFSTYAHVVQ